MVHVINAKIKIFLMYGHVITFKTAEVNAGNGTKKQFITWRS